MDSHHHTNSSNLQVQSTKKTKILLLGETISDIMEFTKTVSKLLNMEFKGFSSANPFLSHEGITNSGRIFTFLLGEYSSIQSEGLKLSFSKDEHNILALVVNEGTFLSRIDVIIKDLFPLNLFSRVIFLFDPDTSYMPEQRLNEISESCLRIKSNISGYHPYDFLSLIVEKRKIFNITKTIRKKTKLRNKIHLRKYEGKDNIHTDRNPHSLISISREVDWYIRNKKCTKGPEVTRYILHILSDLKTEINFKNIQRRVYDALNVMIAIGLVEKKNNKLTYIADDMRTKLQPKLNESNTSHATKVGSSVGSISPTVSAVDQYKLEINNKQHQLISVCAKYHFLKKLIHLNQRDPRRKFSEDRLKYPFFLIKQAHDSAFIIKQDELNNRVGILSDVQLQIIDEDEVVRTFLKDDNKNITSSLDVSEKSLSYIKRHQLVEKYFKNLPVFNTNSSSFKEDFNVYISRSPMNYHVDNLFNFHEVRKSSVDFILQEKEQYIESSFNNLNNFSNCFDLNERMNEFNMDNQLSTNFFSKY